MMQSKGKSFFLAIIFEADRLSARLFMKAPRMDLRLAILDLTARNQLTTANAARLVKLAGFNEQPRRLMH
jgi:hypothetical protein